MSEELKGYSSGIVGTESYIKIINEKNYIGKVLGYNCLYDYKQCLDQLSRKAKSFLDDIYDDLKSHSRQLRYISNTKRRNLEKYVESIAEFCGEHGNSFTKKSDIISLLTLSDNCTKLYSDITEDKLNDVAKYIEGNSYFNTSTSMDLISSVITWDIAGTVGNDEKKFYFFYELSKIYDYINNNFYYDLKNYMLNRKSFSLLKGKNDKELCSREYIEYFDKKIFDKIIMDSSYSGHNDFINNCLENIKKEIEYDIHYSTGSDKYIVYENRKNIKKIAKSLNDVKIRDLKILETETDKFRRLEDFDNKIIEINKTGNSYPVEAELIWKNGKNILEINANVTYYFNNSKYKSEIEKGFKAWSGNYEVFNNQKIEVTVTVNDVGFDDYWVRKIDDFNQLLVNKSIENFKKTVSDDIIRTVNIGTIGEGNRSFAFGGGDSTGLWGWLPQTFLPKIMALGLDGETIDSDTAKHEFGHMLGLGDLYTDTNLGLPGVPPDTYKDLIYKKLNKNDNELHEYISVMNYNGNITNNDVEMVIRAFQTGKRQNYQTQDANLLGGIISTGIPPTGIKIIDDNLAKIKISVIDESKISDVIGRGN